MSATTTADAGAGEAEPRGLDRGALVTAPALSLSASKLEFPWPVQIGI